VTPLQEIYVNADPVPLQDLEGALRVLLLSKPDTPVVLQGDREVLLGEAVKILSAAQRAGATQVAIAAERGRRAE
jgi:biopolymer transport protein ExbD